MRTPQASGGHRLIRRMRAARWLVLAGLLALSQAAAAGLVAFEPVLVEGRVLMKAEPQGAYKTPVVRPLSGPLGPALAQEARTGTTAFMLQLDAAAQRLAGHALLGRAGDAEAFAARLAPARKALTECVEAVARDPNRLGNALGPELWTAALEAGAPASQQGPTPADPAPAAVNLNTAERSLLILWLKLDASTADGALASRAAEGPFKDLADFARRAGLTAQREAQLRAGAAAILAAGPLARE